MPLQLGCIVEGHGERDAVPVLIRRLAAEVAPGAAIETHVLRTPRSQLLRPRELERAVELTARRVGRSGAILVLLDSDDDCPAELGPALLDRARRARADVPLSVVLAKREFEAWFIASANSLRSARGIAGDLEAGVDPESIRGAKEWIEEVLFQGAPYSETIDQPALAATFDLTGARRAGSFDKCFREVSWLLRTLAGG